MNRDELRGYVLTRLGAPTIQVELDNTHIDVAIEDTLRLFNRYLYEYESRILTEQQDAVRIQLEDDVTGVLYLKCLFPETLSVFLQMNIFELMYRMVFPKLPIGEWYQLRSFYEMYRRIRGTEPDWHYDEFQKILMVDCHSGPFDIAYLISKKLSLESVGEGLSWYDHEFHKGVLAQSKKMLGRIRGKFTSTIPAPSGMSLTTDASDLLREGEMEWKEVEEKVNDVMPVAPIMIG
jgi:hypothetical protein